MSTRGRFITFEGGEGAGKSTQAAFLVGYLRATGHKVVETREPGGTVLAEQLRELLIRTEHAPPPIAELLMMFAARADHIAQVIEPALRRGEWVVCDRFTDASFAYQGGGRGLPEAWLKQLEAMVHPDLQPDLTILLELPIEVGLERVHRRAAADRFEREQKAFFQRVQNAYCKRAQQYPDRFVCLDGSEEVEAVRQAIAQAVEERLA